MSSEHITDERLEEVLTEAYGSPEWTMADVRAARAVEAASLALRPAVQPTAAVPAGWKLVPVEPTPEMGEAYLAAAKIHAAYGRENVMRFSVGGYQAMLSAAPAAQPVGEITREQINALLNDESQDSKEMHEFAREILALRPTPQPVAVPDRVPMTDEQIRSMCKQGWVFETVKQWVRVIEAHHGITTPKADK